MSLRIVAEMRSVEETMDEEGLWGDSNLAPNWFAIIVANQGTRNLIVEISKEIRRQEKLNQTRSNAEEKRRASLLLLPKITMRCSSLGKKIMLI